MDGARMTPHEITIVPEGTIPDLLSRQASFDAGLTQAISHFAVNALQGLPRLLWGGR